MFEQLLTTSLSAYNINQQNNVFRACMGNVLDEQ